MNQQNICDIVICGPDMSGTSTQIADLITYFTNSGKQVRDIRGTEIDALFHAECFTELNKEYISLKAFMGDTTIPENRKTAFLLESYKLLSGYDLSQDLRVASMVQNNISTYIDPESADVWIMEEPTRRGAGQVNRTLEQNRTAYGGISDHVAASLAHQAYRADEFYRFRNPLRKAGKTIIRSRSEESACYQIADEHTLPEGISREDYLSLPGHQIAFSHPPTHLFVVCGPEHWQADAYKQLKEQRTGTRILDDYEANVPYQLMVNDRYAGSWINDLYAQACTTYGSEVPDIVRFDIYKSKDEISKQMIGVCNHIK